MKKTKLFKLIGIAGISLVIASSSVATGFAATATSKAVSASYAQQQSQITLSQATDIALKDAGVKKSDAKITEAKAEKYDRTPHYEIEFIANAKEYEYEIAMSNGKILKKEVENTSSSKPSADASNYISLDEAKEIALKEAKVSSENAKFIKAELDKDGRTAHYDIEFVSGKYKYEVEINAKTGKVTDYERERADKEDLSAPSEGNSEYISLDEAKEIALKRAKVSSENAKFIKAELDKDGRTAHYDIEFVSGKYKYEVEINAKTGKVTDYERERADKEDLSAPSEGNSEYISLDEAKKIALKRARVNESKATFTKAELDKDGRTAHYEIEFTAGKYKYEVEVNAKTGKVTDYERDRKPAQPSSKHISAQKAADIALSHAKLDSASVRDLKTDFNKRLFVSFYEVEFESGNYEYEYKINAKTGKIISVDKSWD